MPTFQRRDGSSFVDVGKVERWTGSAFTPVGFVRRWTGSVWEDVWPLTAVTFKIVGGDIGGFLAPIGTSSSQVTLTLRRDGQMEVTSSSNLVSPSTSPVSGEWADGAPLSSTFGDAYDVYVTLDTGELSSGTTGSWLQMNTNRSWSVSQAGNGTAGATLSFEVRRRSDNTVLYTAPSGISLTASVFGL